MNRSEATVPMPSTSDRASVTRAQVARIGHANIEQMTAQLDPWGSHLDTLVARVIASGTDGGADHHEDLDALKVKRELARARFEEFKNAGGAQWQLFQADIEPAWTNFKAASEKLTNSLSSQTTAWPIRQPQPLWLDPKIAARWPTAPPGYAWRQTGSHHRRQQLVQRNGGDAGGAVAHGMRDDEIVAVQQGPAGVGKD